MAANVYECMFLLNASKMAGDQPGVVGQLHTILERNQAEVLASRPWGDDRRLAYSIKSHKKGLYYLIYFRTEGKNVVGLERDCALSELILRQMVLKVDPKLEEIMLQVARDEHALALQSVTAESGEGEGNGEARPDEGEHRGRRRREFKDEG